MSGAYSTIYLFQKLEIKHALQKGAGVATIRSTTPAAPLHHAYQGGFLFSFLKSLHLNADLLRRFSSPKPRLILPPIGGKLRSYSIYHLKNRQAASAGMEGCP